MNTDNRIHSAISAGFALCLILTGVYLLIYLFGTGLGKQYTFTVNNSETIVDGMDSLENSIASRFPDPVTVGVYNSDHVLMETLDVTPGDMRKPIEADIMRSLDHADVYSRLRMYAEPDRLDLFLRKISVDKAVFSKFTGDLLAFDIQALKESAKPVFFR